MQEIARKEIAPMYMYSGDTFHITFTDKQGNIHLLHNESV